MQSRRAVARPLRSDFSRLAPRPRNAVCVDRERGSTDDPLQGTQGAGLGEGAGSGTCPIGGGQVPDRGAASGIPNTPHCEENPQDFSDFALQCSQVDALGPKQLELLALRIEGLRTAKNKTQAVRRSLESDWHTTAVRVLEPMGLAVLPLGVLGRLNFVASFRKGIVVAENYVDRLAPRSISERAQLRLQLGGLLLRWMRTHKYSSSFKAWAQNLQHIPTAARKGFPGYPPTTIRSVLLR